MAVGDIQNVVPGRLTFARDNAFQKEVRRRVDHYFSSSGIKHRDCPAMYLKTAIILSAFAGFYFLLVFVANTWWQALPLAFALGMAMAAMIKMIVMTIKSSISEKPSHFSRNSLCLIPLWRLFMSPLEPISITNLISQSLDIERLRGLYHLEESDQNLLEETRENPMGSAWRPPTLLDLPPDCGVCPLRRIVASVLCLGRPGRVLRRRGGGRGFRCDRRSGGCHSSGGVSAGDSFAVTGARIGDPYLPGAGGRTHNRPGLPVVSHGSRAIQNAGDHAHLTRRSHRQESHCRAR